MQHDRVETIFADTNVGPAHFKGNNKLVVREMFQTIQGEMPFAGYPAVFVRLGGCNRGAKVDIACEACDTDFRLSHSEEYSIDEEFVEKLYTLLKTPSGTRLLVITGGEPLLQQAQLAKLLDELREYVVKINPDQDLYLLPKIQFETNGDFAPRQELLVAIYEYERCLWGEKLEKVYFVISPKGKDKKHAWYSDFIAINGEFAGSHLTAHMINHKYSFFIRRVVSSQPDSIYYDIPESIKGFAKNFGEDKVYVSPLTVYENDTVKSKASSDDTNIDLVEGSYRKPNNEVNSANLKRALELAEKHGYIISFQSHVYMSIR